MVGEELYGGSSQGLVGAGIAQVNLQSHLCEETRVFTEPGIYIYTHRSEINCNRQRLTDTKHSGVIIIAS